MSNAVRLALGVDADTSDAVRGFEDVAQAAKGMADDVDRAASDADSSVSGLGGSVETAGTNAATAAGAFGDLGGALAMVPGPLGAIGTGMETAAPAIQGVTGAADLLNLAMETQVIKMVASYVQTIALTAAQKVAAAATKVWTGIQWAFNAAMSANPIGLVVLAVIALIAVIVIAYKKSDTFRAIVQKLGSVAVAVFHAIVNAAQAVYKWVKDKLGPVFVVYATIVKTQIKIVVAVIKGLLAVVKTVADGIKTAFTKSWDKVKQLLSWDPTKTIKRAWDGVKGVLTKPFTDAWEAIKKIFGPGGSISGIGTAMVSAVRSAVNEVIAIINKLINAFNKLPGPNIPNVPSVSSAAAAGAAGGAAAVSRMGVAQRGATITRGAAAGGVVINIFGAVDTYGTAQQIRRVLARGTFISGRVSS